MRLPERNAASITTTPKGYITDADGQGALQVLAADSINVRFNTGMLAGATPLRVAASGLTSSAVQDGIFAFQTLRPVTFAVLNTYRSTITAQTALSINSLTLRDWLLVNSGTSSIALQAAAAPPGIPGRTIATGKLTTAKLVVTPAVATGKIGVQLNGGTR